MSVETLCIGSALWDVIGHADRPMEMGFDRPGRISRHPGGVALNVAYALVRSGVTPTMLTAIGRDPDGDTLIAQMASDGVDCQQITRVNDRTDMYMAIEHEGDLFGAVADCAALEKAGTTIFDPLTDGRIGDGGGFKGTAIIDGNLPVPVLEHVVESGILAEATVLFVPASPGKARRMTAILNAAGATICVNRIEAEIICNSSFDDSWEAAIALAALGCSAIVTDSARPASLIRDGNLYSTTPPDVEVFRITGAGDAFLAGFVAAQLEGRNDPACLDAAAAAAALYISEPM